MPAPCHAGHGGNALATRCFSDSSAWSRDGEWIAGIERTGVWLVSPDGKETRQVSKRSFTSADAPAHGFSADGSRLYLLRNEGAFAKLEELVLANEESARSPPFRVPSPITTTTSACACTRTARASSSRVAKSPRPSGSSMASLPPSTAKPVTGPWVKQALPRPEPTGYGEAQKRLRTRQHPSCA